MSIVAEPVSRVRRAIYLTLGSLFFALGMIGAVLPIMPTVPFLLVASACFARASPRYHRWLRQHRHFGKAIRDWEDHRAMSRRGKWLATPAILFAFGASMVIVRDRLVLVGILFVLMTGLLFFILRLPDPPQKDPVKRPE